MNATPAFALAVRLHRQGQLAEAEPYYRAALEERPSHAEAWNLLSMLLGAQGKITEAVQCGRKAIEIEPSVDAYFVNLGQILADAGMKQEAETVWRSALDRNTHSDALTPLLQLLRETGRGDEADRLYALQSQIAKEERLDVYRELIQNKRSGPYMDYPSHVHMETMAKCNAACVFCPYPTLERQGAAMSDALIDKIITDLTDIPKGLKFQLSPFKVNEPFLDVRLFDILRTINEKLPNAALTLTTNASPATEKNLDQLSKVRNLEELWISFNDHRETEYEATMKLPYKRTIERLDAIHARVASGTFPFRVVLSRVGDGSLADEEFKHWVHAQYPEFYHSVIQRGAWIGQVDNIDQNVPDVGCSRWFELSITATGVVAHCCMDGQAKWPIGDVTKQHVLDIYNSPHYRALREKTITRLDASPCNQCAFL